MSTKRERRFLTRDINIDDTSGSPKIRGYAAVFNSMSEDLGGFREVIAPGAFDSSLSSIPDVRALFNHDPNLILGRTIPGTLRLSVDDTGLAYEIDPPDTQAARDLMTSMKRGDVNQSSFGFYCDEDDWTKDAEGCMLRTIRSASLFDVSPVTYPAYPEASSGVRNLRGVMFPDGDVEIPVQQITTPISIDESDNDDSLLALLAALQS